MHQCLQSSVADYILDSRWKLPYILSQNCPALGNLLAKIFIPVFRADDHLIWKNSSSVSLSFKHAFLHFQPAQQNCKWSKIIWSPAIPPSKSFVFWRLLHKKLPSDKQLHKRGCIQASVCSLCYANFESIELVFFNCLFAKKLWIWLSSIIHHQVDTSSMDSVLSVCSLPWSL